MRSFLVLILLVLAGAAAVTFDARRSLHAPLTLTADLKYAIPNGSSLHAVLADLRRQGYLPNAQRLTLYVRAYARFTGLGTRIKAGEYALSPGVTILNALSLFESGQTVVYALQLIEGWTARQAVEVIRAHPEIVATPELGMDGIASQLGLASPRDLEGRLFPETYHFSRGTSDLALIRRAYDMQQAVLAEEWAARDPELPYASADEALTMASIIEKETGVPYERAEIAGVFVRRLNLGMRLQTDPTVIYGLGDAFDGNLRRRDLTSDTPYNTYTRTGLPPTPICLPGRAAIHAALHPADGETLYFVSKGDGSHQFSRTLSEHQAAVRQYQLRKR